MITAVQAQELTAESFAKNQKEMERFLAEDFVAIEKAIKEACRRCGNSIYFTPLTAKEGLPSGYMDFLRKRLLHLGFVVEETTSLAIGFNISWEVKPKIYIREGGFKD